jgi:nucleoid DNA-binding protein
MDSPGIRAGAWSMAAAPHENASLVIVQGWVGHGKITGFAYRRTGMAGKRLTKAQVIAELAGATDLDKKSVARVFEGLSDLIRKQLSVRGPGEFVVPGLVKLRVVKKPATKERQGINPFTKEPITIPAKPASKKVRATALKALKDLVQ